MSFGRNKQPPEKIDTNRRKNGCFWKILNQTLNKYTADENKIKKNKNSKDFLLNTKQVFSRRSLASLLREYGK